MGYFWRKIDRGRCRAEAESLAEQPLPDLPWQAIPPRPPTKLCLVRFSTLRRDRESGRRQGFLSITYEVIRNPDTEHATAQGLQSALDWFEENLPGPNIFNARAIWFFKSSATTCMARAWELIHWLREAGVVIEMQIAEANSGWTCYEDEHQVAVVPHSDSGVV